MAGKASGGETMKSRIAVFVMPVLALCIGGGLLIAVLYS
jgi:hypothetical protein